MIRSPILFGRWLDLRGAPNDNYFADLPNGAVFVDDVLQVLERLVPDDAVVVDVGANVGMHTLGLAMLVPKGHVHAFEPNPRINAFLQHNVRANHATNVTTYAAALGANEGSLPFFDNREFGAGSMVVDAAETLQRDYLENVTMHGRPNEDPAARPRGQIITVPCTTLDAFADEQMLQRLDLVKVDAEGFDLEVLRGGRGILQRLRPVVIVEFATLALTLHMQTLPASALDELRGMFDHVFVVEPDGNLRKLATDVDAFKLLYENATESPVQDLVCAYDDSPLLGRAVEIASSPRPGPDELQRELTEARNQAVKLSCELEALQRSASWRLTKPLRAAMSFVRNRRR